MEIIIIYLLKFELFALNVNYTRIVEPYIEWDLVRALKYKLYFSSYKTIMQYEIHLISVIN